MCQCRPSKPKPQETTHSPVEDKILRSRDFKKLLRERMEKKLSNYYG